MALTTPQIKELRDQLAAILGTIAGGTFTAISLQSLFGRAAQDSGEGAGTPSGALSTNSYKGLIGWLAAWWDMSIAETEQFIGQLAIDSGEVGGGGSQSPSLTNAQKIAAMNWFMTRLRLADPDGSLSEAECEAFFGRAAFNSGLLVSSPASISGLVAWYRADLGITVTGLGVSTWGDQVAPAVDFAQGTDADRPALVASDANFGNLPSVDFDVANTEFMAAGVAADWTFLHDGTGMTVYAVFRNDSGANSTLIDTNNGSTTNLGVLFRVDGANGRLRLLMGNGSASTMDVQTGAGTLPDGAPHILCVAYGEGASPTEYEIRIDRNATASGNSAQAPGSGAPFGTLTMGKLTASTQYLDGPIAELAIYNRRLSTAEMQQLETYASRYAL